VAGLFLALAVLVGILAGIVIDRWILAPPVAAVARAAGAAAGHTEGAAPGATPAAPGTTAVSPAASATAPAAGPTAPAGSTAAPPARAGSGAGGGPGLAGGRVLAWMADSLDLSAEQRGRIAAIIREERVRADRLTRTVRPGYRRLVRRTRLRVLAVLTPEQRARLRALLRERRRAGPPRPGGGDSLPRR